MRNTSVTRNTKETKIELQLLLDGSGKAAIQTGVGFFDHMLTALTVHAGWDLSVTVQGDLEVDCHHTIEDTGIVLGQALGEILGNAGGIQRYGSAWIPMDEALAFACLDISKRPFLVFQCPFDSPMIGSMDTQMLEEFFRAVAFGAGITLHLKLEYGKNDHHKAEAIFKAFAHAIKQATTLTGEDGVLSSKGVL